MNIKQVIVMRKDLKMRRGKEIAQGAHAAMEWLRARLRNFDDIGNDRNILDERLVLTDPEVEWLSDGLMTKVTVQVEGVSELLAVYEAAKKAGLEVHIIEDAGLTEFRGIPTHTCLAIGPDEAEKIDAVTAHLKLY